MMYDGKMAHRSHRSHRNGDEGRGWFKLDETSSVGECPFVDAACRWAGRDKCRYRVHGNS